MKTLLKHSLLAFTIAVATSSCIKDKGTTPKKFSVSKFKALLKAGILQSKETQPRGFSFVITQNGKWVDTCSGGYGYLVGDRVSPMRPELEINIASVTKSITGVAALQLLKKNNLKVTDSIGPWLPAYFKAIKAVRDITFKELLTHRSGILTDATSYEAMKLLAQNGLENPAKPAFYSNMNFALFRAMIPYLYNKSFAQQTEAAMLPDSEGFENWMSQNYIAYMQKHVFTPIGIAEALCKPDGPSAMAFNEGPKLAYHQPGDWTHSSGGGGYYLSTMEMARFMAYLCHSETLLSKEQQAAMDKDLLGWDEDDSHMTIIGRSYGKGGLLVWDGGRGIQTVVVKYPNKVELAVSVNSWSGTKRQLSVIAKNAFNDAWE